MSVSEKAQEIHDIMVTNMSSSLQSFSQTDLSELVQIENAEDLMKHIQELLNHKLVKLIQSQGALRFQPVNETDAAKVMRMSKDEAMVYSYIEASGREGIWTKTIKARTNLHQHIVLRCLKSLENQSFIKSVKSVKHPTRKIYMLYHLTPSIDVTGGPWFTDSELDTEFIDSLLVVTWRYVASKSYPNAFKKTGALQESYPASHIQSMPTTDDICKFIGISGITSVELTPSDIRSLCDVLVYDGKLDRVNGGDSYMATWQSILESRGDETDSIEHPYSIFDTHQASENMGGDYDESEEMLYLDSWIST
ncbi:unnamed protein product [Kuraishia capsulata CBS 1993]|uniref:DNA-directed RNA polymerase III subunit RPC6 n=1 Tax=Kuraishia capsulata CBS 1993 TaxID=1382522 RepID=W6MGF5_9ASCO|nr:uncharacterized protein KUCA_T00000544001 [Kuraishia capsulata CBS 1993]CDK24578.1 unnamed protein product [Kuraishia capsulata CBS 1993]